MSKYLDPTDRPSYGVAVCDRCQTKYFLDELSPDRDKPGLRVCRPCNDEKDPWRLPPRRPDQIALRFPRPDVPLETD